MSDGVRVRVRVRVRVSVRARVRVRVGVRVRAAARAARARAPISGRCVALVPSLRTFAHAAASSACCTADTSRMLSE